ncbi:MAG: glycosyltransferase family 4 protein [Bacteroidales bacterium]|nr:glycosyltransferase family 4 protein [Bacteroidales bacterium]
MEKVILLEPVLAHYRKDVFESFLKSKDFNFEIVAGRSYQGINSLKGNEKSLFSHASFKLFNHTFYFLKGAIKFIYSKKPSIIICTGVDFHLIHTLIIYLIHRILFRKKFYWWSHATTGNQGRVGYLMRKLIYKTSSGILSYNREGRDNLLLMGINDKKIKVVNNSLNKEDYGYLNHDIFKNNNDNDKFTILYSGRITKAKKVDLLIKALGLIKEKNLFDFKCYIIGDGNLEQCIKLAKEFCIDDKIDFVGAKYGKEARSYFLDSDLFVYPGGIGLSILHSMSFGVPVITTNNTDLHFPEFELLQQGYNGELYVDESYEDLANKIVEWKGKLNDSKDFYAKNCINRIKEMGYLPDIMVEKVLDFLRSRA